jgi:hypothetical protein
LKKTLLFIITAVLTAVLCTAEFAVVTSGAAVTAEAYKIVVFRDYVGIRGEIKKVLADEKEIPVFHSYGEAVG